MKSFLAKNEDVQQKWLLVDANGAILGRLATKLATILMGKHKPTYTPNVDTGDYVIVLNAEKIKLTGNKEEAKLYDYYTFYPGGHKYLTFPEMLAKNPAKIIELAVKRMLPKSAMGDRMLKKLKVYAGTEHPHTAQAPEKIEL